MAAEKKVVKRQWQKAGSDILFYGSGILFIYNVFYTRELIDTVFYGVCLILGAIAAAYFEIVQHFNKMEK